MTHASGSGEGRQLIVAIRRGGGGGREEAEGSGVGESTNEQQSTTRSMSLRLRGGGESLASQESNEDQPISRRLRSRTTRGSQNPESSSVEGGSDEPFVGLPGATGEDEDDPEKEKKNKTRKRKGAIIPESDSQILDDTTTGGISGGVIGVGDPTNNQESTSASAVSVKAEEEEEETGGITPANSPSNNRKRLAGARGRVWPMGRDVEFQPEECRTSARLAERRAANCKKRLAGLGLSNFLVKGGRLIGKGEGERGGRRRKEGVDVRGGFFFRFLNCWSRFFISCRLVVSVGVYIYIYINLFFFFSC
ncbi:hypothetical protein QBC38DRAFT_157037 [Podospora fimiseda]|uniref:Uncharacterized protein n=1 Tax=Podospora fimiseda TaxID=252190 RepID=A0AAN7BS41_9PEZI|nr:hypothetical protein QBC38DRAFT_157037 [Podospora fimiseda]